MRVIGIIAEFNPLHKGHEILISEAKKAIGDPRAVTMAVMSGPFSQRGDICLLSKSLRAKQALKCGVDVVLELPFTFAVAPSSRFGSGAVELLHKTGVVTDLAFGIDLERPEILFEIAKIIPDEDVISDYLQNGFSYPRARAEGIISRFMSDPKLSSIYPEEEVRTALRKPNAILGLEYVIACKKLGCRFKIHMIKRTADYSASSTRDLILNHEDCLDENIKVLSDFIPVKPLSLMLSELHNGNSQIADYDSYILDSIIRQKTSLDFSSYSYMGDDLSSYIDNNYSKIREGKSSYSDIIPSLATKRYTIGRIKRALASMMVGQKQNYVDNENDIQYIRVLGFNREGQYCLKIMGRNNKVPIIHNASDFLHHLDNTRLISQSKLDIISEEIHNKYIGIPYGRSFNESPIIYK